ncbi:Hypothetical_protein [Hexamita inflata]|uniref:Hypothetical_protein n=1 Tax=Hexamita inflata TaxID=28002 RepID=A0AA86UVD6_9EUKA|nr:Hypothetical protein HINF_LOCUS56969 [Hexamita inflata]
MHYYRFRNEQHLSSMIKISRVSVVVGILSQKSFQQQYRITQGQSFGRLCLIQPLYIMNYCQLALNRFDKGLQTLLRLSKLWRCLKYHVAVEFITHAFLYEMSKFIQSAWICCNL